MNPEYLLTIGALIGFTAGYFFGSKDMIKMSDRLLAIDKEIAGSSGDSNAVVAPAIAPGEANLRGGMRPRRVFLEKGESMTPPGIEKIIADVTQTVVDVRQEINSLADELRRVIGTNDGRAHEIVNLIEAAFVKHSNAVAVAVGVKPEADAPAKAPEPCPTCGQTPPAVASVGI